MYIILGIPSRYLFQRGEMHLPVINNRLDLKSGVPAQLVQPKDSTRSISIAVFAPHTGSRVVTWETLSGLADLEHFVDAAAGVLPLSWQAVRATHPSSI